MTKISKLELHYTAIMSAVMYKLYKKWNNKDKVVGRNYLIML